MIHLLTPGGWNGNCLNWTGTSWGGISTDWTGATYTPDVRNIMSYYDNDCTNLFSNGQRNTILFTMITLGDLLWTANMFNAFDTFEPDNSSVTARPIAVGETQEHSFHWCNPLNIGSNDDQDWLSFSIAEGQSLVAYTNQAGSTDTDTEITIFDQDLNQVAFDDNSNDGEFSKVMLENLPAGDYFMRITFNSELFSFNSIADYFITLEECVPSENCAEGIYIHSRTRIMQSTQKFTAPCNNSFVVASGASLIIRSEGEIEFLPGFEVEAGADFLAEIAPTNCNPDIIRKSGTKHTSEIFYTETQNYQNNSHLPPKENQPNNTLNVFPNPATEFVYFNISEMPLGAYASYQIVNIAGKVIKQDKIVYYGQTKIDISGLNSGFYVLKIVSENKIYSSKIIKK